MANYHRGKNENLLLKCEQMKRENLEWLEMGAPKRTPEEANAEARRKIAERKLRQLARAGRV